MKKLIYLLVFVAFVASCTNEPKYVVEGNLNGADTGLAVLHKNSHLGEIIDSARIINGVFKMEGSVDYPQQVALTIDGRKRSFLYFFLENSRITINGHADTLYKAEVTGSLTQKEYEVYNDSMGVLETKIEEVYQKLREAEKAGDKDVVAKLNDEAEDMEGQYVVLQKEFVKNNPKSFVCPIVLSDLLYYLSAGELESLLGGLDSTLLKVDIIYEIQEKLKVMKTVDVGQKAPDFTMNDVNGNPVSLYSKVGGRNKLLLIDFWASWCKPCRMENPNVVRVWKEYNKKGFDVFGISLDTDGENWRKAIETDQLTWTHVSDLKRFDCEPVRLYVVVAIPSNYLIDENGIIIAHNLRGKDLESKVQEILGTR